MRSGPKSLLRRTLLTLALAMLFLLVPWPKFRVGPTELHLPSVKSAVVVFCIVIALGKTLYDTLFWRGRR